MVWGPILGDHQWHDSSFVHVSACVCVCCFLEEGTIPTPGGFAYNDSRVPVCAVTG